MEKFESKSLRCPWRQSTCLLRNEDSRTPVNIFLENVASVTPRLWIARCLRTCMCICICICVYVYIYIYIYIYICIHLLHPGAGAARINSTLFPPQTSKLGATQKGGRGLVNLRLVIFLEFPYINICFFVWDSGLQLIYVNWGKFMEMLNYRFTNPSFWFYR